MNTEPRENRIDYVEFPALSNESHTATKRFYRDVFGWSFQEWSDDYSDTKDSGVTSGINSASSHRPSKPLVVLFSSDLEAARNRVVKAGGQISKDIFSFPGGRRFHYIDPSGNELGVWSDK
jgi:predicted enzyme related to lactoylglutathione lyase